jgi:hypothetical protein
VRDLAAGTTVLASLADGTAATAANGPAESVALDAGGGCLAFDSTADNLADPGYPTRDFSQAYLRVLGDECPSRTPATTTSTTLPRAVGAPLAAKTLVVRPGRLVKLVARGDLPPTDDPQVAGATLEVAGTTGAAAWALPAAGWKRVGRHAPRGFRFRGEECRAAFGRRRVVVTCRGATGGLALPEPGPVRVTLALGPQAYCAECGGKPAGRPARVFKRRRCEAPAACPQ